MIFPGEYMVNQFTTLLNSTVFVEKYNNMIKNLSNDFNDA